MEVFLGYLIFFSICWLCVVHFGFNQKNPQKPKKNNPKTASYSRFQAFLYALIMYQRLYARLTSIDI